MQRFFKHLPGLIELEAELNTRIAFPVQLGESEDQLVLRVFAPGIKQEDLDVTISGQNISISGRLACKNGLYLQQECPCGMFHRNIALPCQIDSDKASAELKAGILTLTLPRKNSCKSRRINVEKAS